MNTGRDDVTGWLRAWSSGDETALEKLIPLVYGELHQRARRLMGRERAGHSLQPTALIHEAYLRLVGPNPMDWRDRSHFYALACAPHATDPGGPRAVAGAPEARRRCAADRL